MPRHLAWSVLRSGSPMPLRDLRALAEAEGLEPRDRGLARKLIATETRYRGTLRALVRHFCERKPNPDVIAHLHLGFVQLFLLDAVPDHATLSETVRATHETLGPRKARFVNAVLRSAQRERREGHQGDPRCDIVGRELSLKEPVFRDPEEHPLLWAEDALSMPAPLIKRWIKRYGQEQAFALARNALTEAPLSIRVTTGKREDVADELGELLEKARPGSHPAIWLFDTSSTESILNTPAFAEGRITVQGGTALRAAELLEAREGESVLDVAAAPGGKTAVLAASGALVTATDSSPGRMSRLEQTLERLKLSDRVRCVVSDGTAELAEGEMFDAALIDAPCSNTGVLAQRPEARWRFGPANTSSLIELQTRLLDEAAARIQHGGRLVYSTCSLEPEENMQRIKKFLEDHVEWALDESFETLPEPDTGPIDGGWAFRLRRG